MKLIVELRKLGVEVEEDKNLLKILASPDKLVKVAETLVEAGYDHLANVEGIDWPNENVIEVVYHVESYEKDLRNKLIEIKVKVPRDNPRVPTLVNVWPNALFMERETWEMLGVVFEGHPDLRHLLLPSEWSDIPPLRKDFKVKKEGIIFEPGKS